MLAHAPHACGALHRPLQRVAAAPQAAVARPLSAPAARCRVGGRSPLCSEQQAASRRVVTARGSSVMAERADDDDDADQKKRDAMSWMAMGGVFLLAAAGAAAYVVSGGSMAVLRDVLGRSGFTAALGLILFSEIGDKTFFIAALLAMDLGRALTLAGTMASLSLMTVISVVIGAAFRNVPDALRTSAPIGEWLSVALLVWFGFKTLRGALAAEDDDQGEYEDAQEELGKRGKAKAKTPLGAFWDVASLIFVAEWGDRSMLATVALGAAQNPVGVTLGAILGHFVATVIAVVGGALISRHISEKQVGIIGGSLFLVFAAFTALGIF
ncbi:unnamed protein product [Pedinophyceae sp. YPF-701]|nr:unnamed protein product [Pedinophyceae sp. YPF-701]